MHTEWNRNNGFRVYGLGTNAQPFMHTERNKKMAFHALNTAKEA
jgi:hypothetical protein